MNPDKTCQANDRLAKAPTARRAEVDACRRPKSGVRRFPLVIADNSQVGYFDLDPFSFGAPFNRSLSPGVRTASPIPNLDSTKKLSVQDCSHR